MPSSKLCRDFQHFQHIKYQPASFFRELASHVGNKHHASICANCTTYWQREWEHESSWSEESKVELTEKLSFSRAQHNRKCGPKASTGHHRRCLRKVYQAIGHKFCLNIVLIAAALHSLKSTNNVGSCYSYVATLRGCLQVLGILHRAHQCHVECAAYHTRLNCRFQHNSRLSGL